MTAATSNPLHVLLVAPSPPPYGGISNWTRMLEDFVSRTNQVRLSTVNTAPKRRDVDGRGGFERVVGQSLGMAQVLHRIRGIARVDRPDVVHVTTSGHLSVVRDLAVLFLCRMYRLPTVYQIRFGRVPDIARARNLEWRLISKAFRLADRVLALDHLTREAVERGVPDARVTLVPNPIDISTLPQQRSNQKTIVFLGWVKPQKGVEDLLCAWTGLHRDYPDWKLQIVGPAHPEYQDILRARFPVDGVDYMGERSHGEALQIIAASSVFVLPSHTEGFPNSILEAMALSKCVLGSSVGAIPEMLANGCGMVIPPQRPQELERALRQLLDEPETRMECGQKAAAKVSSTYSIEHVFAAYLTEWTNVRMNLISQISSNAESVGA